MDDLYIEMCLVGRFVRSRMKRAGHVERMEEDRLRRKTCGTASRKEEDGNTMIEETRQSWKTVTLYRKVEV